MQKATPCTLRIFFSFFGVPTFVSNFFPWLLQKSFSGFPDFSLTGKSLKTLDFPDIVGTQNCFFVQLRIFSKGQQWGHLVRKTPFWVIGIRNLGPGIGIIPCLDCLLLLGLCGSLSQNTQRPKKISFFAEVWTEPWRNVHVKTFFSEEQQGKTTIDAVTTNWIKDIENEEWKILTLVD